MTLLADELDESVLIAGGGPPEDPLDSAEIWDMVTGVRLSWSFPDKRPRIY